MGKLIVQEAGDPALPGAGRKKNPFREAIAAYADGGSEEVVWRVNCLIRR